MAVNETLVAGAGSLEPIRAGDMIIPAPGTGTMTTLADLLAATSGGPGVFATLKLTTIPTADPHVAGAVWSNSGVLTLSAG